MTVRPGVDRRFRVLISAYAVSTYGNYVNLIALGLFSYAVTGTAFGVGAVMVLRLVCGFLAGLTAGALLARAAHRTVMVCADIAQGTAMAVLALNAGHTPLWLLAGTVVVLGAGNTFFTVALRSAIPAMVGPEARTRANGLLVMSRSLATVVGFASAAPVIGFGGYALAFAFNAVSFAVSAVALLALRPGPSAAEGPAPADPDAQEERTASASRPAGAGVRRAAAALPALLIGMVVLRGLDALASSSHNVALPVVAHSTAPAEPAVYMTRFWAAWAVGTFLAHLVLKSRKGEAAWGERAFALGTCAMSLSFAAAFLGLPAFAVVLAAVSAGFADGWTEIVYASRLQALPEPRRSRLFGLSATVEQSGFALGTVAASAALEMLPASAVVSAFHFTALCGALVLLLYSTIGRRGTAPPRMPASATD